MPDKKWTLVGNGGVRLSGGQAQRLALARTLCHLRPVMILDDPFSALDKKTEAEIFSNIRQLAGDAIVLLDFAPGCICFRSWIRSSGWRAAGPLPRRMRHL